MAKKLKLDMRPAKKRPRGGIRVINDDLIGYRNEISVTAQTKRCELIDLLMSIIDSGFSLSNTEREKFDDLIGVITALEGDLERVNFILRPFNAKV